MTPKIEETTAILSARALAKTYRADGTEAQALRGVDLALAPGEFVAVMGPSGCGKSTLLHLLGGLDRPTSGEIVLAGQRVDGLSEARWAKLRRRQVGFVFQLFNLVGNLTVADNVELPALLAGFSAGEARRRREALLEELGIADKAGAVPAQLSGGQQQRVALARALINRPAILLADEPTGNLDTQATRDVLALLSRRHGQGQAILLVTHDARVASVADRVISMRDGRIVDDTPLAAGADDARLLSSLIRSGGLTMLRALARTGLADLRRHRLQTAMIFVILVTATASLALAVTVRRMADGPFDRMMRETNGAHLWFVADPGVDLGSLAGMDGVESTAGPFAVATSTWRDPNGRRCPVSSCGRWRSRPRCRPTGRPLIESGRWLRAANEVVLDPDIAIIRLPARGRATSSSFRDRMGRSSSTSSGRPSTSRRGRWRGASCGAEPPIYVLPETLERLAPDRATWQSVLGVRLQRWGGESRLRRGGAGPAGGRE